MTTIKLKEKSFKFKYLTKSIIKEIEKKYHESEKKYGAVMDWYLVNSETLSYSVQEITTTKTGIKHYNPMVTAWDTIKENDDVALVKLDFEISDMPTAFSYAREMLIYIKYMLLKEGIDRLIKEVDTINNLKRIVKNGK